MSNVNKNTISFIDNSKKIHILILVILGIIALSIRLFFLPFNLPLENDAAGYFWYANDIVFLQGLPTEHSSEPLIGQIPNNGWPIFLSTIFTFVDSSNFLDYMNSQRVISSMISVFTIIPIYYLGKRFFSKSYSLIVVTFFVFEPSLIENSILGLTEPLYLFLGVSAITAFFVKSKKFILLSFAIAALFSIVRYEGLLLIIPLSIMYFKIHGIKSNSIKFYFLILIVFVLILLPVGYLRTELNGSDGLTSHVIAGGNYYSTMINQEGNSMILEFVTKGVSYITKFFGILLIPLFLIFVPHGIWNLLKNRTDEKLMLVLLGIVFLIPAFYAYSRGFQDTRYLFIYFIILSIISVYLIQKIGHKIKRKDVVVLSTIFLIILTSFTFVYYTIPDFTNDREQYEITGYVNEISTSINRDYESLFYLKWYDKDIVENFPVLSTDLERKGQANIIFIGNKSGFEFSNLKDYLTYGNEKGLTHLVLDNSNLDNEYLKHVFNNDAEYSFLKKVFDSRDLGYKHHVKVYEIDFERFFSEWEK
tara:strand:+ start:1040 stop:2638 length:1599 start_codon:yes stop_codon:yes gene_type:complete